MSLPSSGLTIGRVKIMLSSKSGLEGSLLLQQLSLLYYRELLHDLEKNLALAPDVQTERVIFSLGTLSAANWEAELLVRFRGLLESQVRRWNRDAESQVFVNAKICARDVVTFEASLQKNVDGRILSDAAPVRGKSVSDTKSVIYVRPSPSHLVHIILHSTKLTCWLKRLNVTTLRSIVTLLVGEIPLKLSSHKLMAKVLSLSALVYLQRHPQIPVPAPPATLQSLPAAIDVTILRNWLPRLLAYPLRAEVRQWLYVLCSTAEAKTCLADALATITPAQARAPLSPVRSDPLELPPASVQPLPFSPLPLSTQPTPRPEPPIRINSGITWPIHEAGLVLLWPLLPSLFKKMGLIVDQQWVQPESHYRALRCLQGLVWGEGPLMWGEDWPDSALLRWLCGMPIGLPLVAPDGFEDNPDDLTELDAWLAKPPTAPLDNWSDFSLAELRERFLQRPGKLSLQGGQWSLEIELEPGAKAPPPVPWPVSVLSYPWLSQPLFISFYEAPSGDENM